MSAPVSTNTEQQQTQRFLINGNEKFGMSKDVNRVYYPADQATVAGECYNLAKEHLPLIEDAAEQGFTAYKNTPVPRRIDILNNLADLLQKQKEDFARLITMEAGKPITLSRHEVGRAIELCRLTARQLEEEPARTFYLDGRTATIQRFPVGPVLAITPYNFPLNLIMHKLAPAIAAGCSFTVKPAPQAPLTALKLGRLAVEAGYRFINVVPASNDVAEALVRSDAFKKLSFTGSDKVGWYLKSIAGKKTVTLELGGNGAVVVEDLTRPPEEVARRIAFGAFAYAGQVCISVQRIFIREELLSQLLPILKETVRSLPVGDPLDEKTVVGPMISVDDVQRTRDLIKQAIFKGANVLYGGNTYNMFTMNPTLMDRTVAEMRVNAEEVFAPIATVTAYKNFDEALRLVNQSRYGLHAGIYVGDEVMARQAFDALAVGGLIINDIPTVRHDLLPYGGVKDSGVGREGALAGIADYTVEKTLIINP